MICATESQAQTCKKVFGKLDNRVLSSILTVSFRFIVHLFIKIQSTIFWLESFPPDPLVTLLLPIWRIKNKNKSFQHKPETIPIQEFQHMSFLGSETHSDSNSIPGCIHPTHVPTLPSHAPSFLFSL